MATLGSMMLSEKAIEDVRSILNSNDFYQPAHAEICRAVFYLFKKKMGVDLVTVKNRLTELGKLESVGGKDYLVQMAESLESVSNAAYYAVIVADKAKMRRLLSASEDIQKLVRDPDMDADEKLSKADVILEKAMVSKAAGAFRSMKELQKETIAEIDEAIESGKGRRGIDSGFSDYDRWISGLFGGHLYIVAARPGIGKSALVATMSLNVARTYGPVAFFSIEMPGKMVNDRLLASEAGVSLNKMLSGKMESEEIQRMYDASENLRNVPLFVDDSPDQTVSSIKSKLRRLRGEHGSVKLAVIDYMQLVKASRRYEQRQVEVSEVARHLKELSKELDIPVIALAQVGRDVERRKNKRPILADLRESGDIEASADVVTLLYRPEHYKQKNDQEDLRMDVPEVCEAIVAKQRNGPTGTVLMGFVPAYTRFCQLTEDSKEAYRARTRAKVKD